MTVKPRAAIVIPMHNNAGAIEYSLASALAQDYDKDKLGIVIVDNRSDDGCYENCLALAKEHAGIGLYRLPEQVLPEYLNIRACHFPGHGKYFTLLEPGDSLRPDFISCCVSELETDARMDCVICETDLKGANRAKPALGPENQLMSGKSFFNAMREERYFQLMLRANAYNYGTYNCGTYNYSKRVLSSLFFAYIKDWYGHFQQNFIRPGAEEDRIIRYIAQPMATVRPYPRTRKRLVEYFATYINVMRCIRGMVDDQTEREAFFARLAKDALTLGQEHAFANDRAEAEACLHLAEVVFPGCVKFSAHGDLRQALHL
ncbi:glycosyltransferase family 2 protein [Desulfovibrio sp. OttesenSCG-928-M14]|nr:glycosyltransferase family 2 protein [Desulfovibrio sp. OttesenSCG-928-M14]